MENYFVIYVYPKNILSNFLESGEDIHGAGMVTGVAAVLSLTTQAAGPTYAAEKLRQ
ncbi:MAG: hypothetical protein LBK75_03035 [Oscillospiraceae bacterium]|jgi:hypothetical protein|nr:hypothetical protein [Oscillospiraceae bacterium]